MSKVSRGQKGEEKVIAVLNRITDYHRLLNNVTIINKKSEMTHQIDHILIHPHGIFVIETKNYFGEIVFDSETKQWWKIVRGEKIRISSPLSQNKSHQIALYRALSGQYQSTPVVVYVQNNAPYLPDDNVINLNDLLLFIDSYPYERKLAQPTIDKIYELIREQCADISLSEHVENIRYLKQWKKEQEAEMRYAIETGKCPWCNSKILIGNGYRYKCSKCKFGFKL